MTCIFQLESYYPFVKSLLGGKVANERRIVLVAHLLYFQHFVNCLTELIY